MSWYSRLVLLVVSGLFSFNAYSQRIQFSNGSQKAEVLSQVLTRGTGPAPVEFSMTLPAIDLDDAKDGFKNVKALGLAPMGKLGSPEVATTGKLIAVPEGFQPVLTVLNQEQKELPGVTIAPAQKKVRCDCPEARNFAFNSTLYNSNSLFPAKNVELEEVGKLQGLRLVRVAVKPLQMDMAKKSLVVTTNIKVRVDFKRTGLGLTLGLPHSIYRLAKELTANVESLSDRVVTAQGPEKMLIVVADSLAESVKPLAAWKTSKGIQTDVVTYTAAGGSKEAVKAYIQKYYDAATPKPSYLIMVGNKDTLPPYMEDTSNGQAASDYRYALLSGDKNIPAVFYGRLVADNADEANTQITRWINYEQHPDRLDWYHDGTAIAGPKGDNPSDKENGQQIQQILQKYSYKTVDGLFDGDGLATVDNVDKSMNAGRSWVTFFGDGSGTGWSWDGINENFGNGDVDKLTNEKLPFIIDVACMNASWVDLPKPFAKAWVTHTANGKPSGAVAYLGGSVSISWNPPAIMAVGIAKSHFEQAIPTLGGSIMAGQLYLIQQIGSGEDALENLRWYNLLGDPSLVMRTDTTAQYQVKYDVKRDAETTVTVTTADSSGKGIAGLTASLSNEGRPTLAVAKTDASGNAVLTLPAGTTVDASTELTVTGVNADTYQTALH